MTKKPRNLNELITKLSGPVDFDQVKEKVKNAAGNTIMQIFNAQSPEELNDALEVLDIIVTIINQVIKPLESIRGIKTTGAEDINLVEYE